MIGEYLRVHPCVDCGETDISRLTFDHRDPATKRGTVSPLSTKGRVQLVLDEIAKCDVRCVDCHERRHPGGTYLHEGHGSPGPHRPNPNYARGG